MSWCSESADCQPSLKKLNLLISICSRCKIYVSVPLFVFMCHVCFYRRDKRISKGVKLLLNQKHRFNNLRQFEYILLCPIKLWSNYNKYNTKTLRLQHPYHTSAVNIHAQKGHPIYFVKVMLIRILLIIIHVKDHVRWYHIGLYSPIVLELMYNLWRVVYVFVWETIRFACGRILRFVFLLCLFQTRDRHCDYRFFVISFSISRAYSLLYVGI